MKCQFLHFLHQDSNQNDVMWCSGARKKSYQFASLKFIQFISSNHHFILHSIVVFFSLPLALFLLNGITFSILSIFACDGIASRIRFQLCWAIYHLATTTHHQFVHQCYILNFASNFYWMHKPQPTTTTSKMIQTTDLQAKNIDA